MKNIGSAADIIKEKKILLGVKNSVTNSPSDIFKMMLSNGLIRKKYSPLKNPSDARRYLRLYRFSVVGESLIEFALFTQDPERFEIEAVSALLDLYLFYTRALYDELMRDVKYIHPDKVIKLPNNFNEFLNKLKNGAYREIDKDSFLYKFLINDSINFKKIRTIRNAIKDNTAAISIIAKEGKMYVRVAGYDKNEKEINLKEINLEEELVGFIYGISFSLWIMMEPELLNYKNKYA